MATTKNGLMGGVPGLIGNVVGVARNGSFYFRTRPVHVKNPNTKKQATQRSKFSVTMAFLKTFTPILRIGFRSDAAGIKSAFNAAMSYNMQHAMKEEDSGFEIDFPKVLVSKGKLPTSVIMQASVAEGSLCVPSSLLLLSFLPGLKLFEVLLQCIDIHLICIDPFLCHFTNG